MQWHWPTEEDSQHFQQMMLSVVGLVEELGERDLSTSVEDFILWIWIKSTLWPSPQF